MLGPLGRDGTIYSQLNNTSRECNRMAHLYLTSLEGGQGYHSTMCSGILISKEKGYNKARNSPVAMIVIHNYKCLNYA